MTDRTIYTSVKPSVAAAPTVQKDRLVEQMGGTHGPAASRARIDTVDDRLARLGVLLQGNPPDWEQLREWRLSQMEQLERLKEWRESPDTFGGLKPKKP
jgi:hypothetical protein